MRKTLKKSLRERKRYLKIQGTKKEAEKAILDYIGVLGYAKAGIKFVKSDILAVNRKELDKVKAALLLADIKVIKVSGTIRKLK